MTNGYCLFSKVFLDRRSIVEQFKLGKEINYLGTYLVISKYPKVI